MKPALAVISSIKITVAPVIHKTYAVVLCLILLISPYCMGTTILVVLHGNHVWIAADSLETANTGQQRRICKINSESRFYWAASSPFYEDPITGYGLPKMVAKVAPTKGTLVDIMNTLIATAKVESAKEFSLLRREYPAEFAKSVQPAGDVLVAKVVFVGKGNGYTPIVITTVITAREVGGNMVISATPATPVHAVNFELGANNVAQDYFLTHAASIKNDDPVPIMHDSIVAAASVDPLHTGGKVSILEISPKGYDWKEKGECQ